MDSLAERVNRVGNLVKRRVAGLPQPTGGIGHGNLAVQDVEGIGCPPAQLVPLFRIPASFRSEVELTQGFIQYSILPQVRLTVFLPNPEPQKLEFHHRTGDRIASRRTGGREHWPQSTP